MVEKYVYICGAISGKENQAKKEFDSANNKIIASGYIPVNPFELDHENNKEWSDFMRTDIEALVNCDFIYFANDISNSEGGQLEALIAEKLNIPEFKIKQ
jgi:hypothetical protein